MQFVQELSQAVSPAPMLMSIYKQMGEGELTNVNKRHTYGGESISL